MSYIGVPGGATSTGVHWGPALHRIQFSILHIFKILDSWEKELYQAMWTASVSCQYGIVSRVAIFISCSGGANISETRLYRKGRIAY